MRFLKIFKYCFLLAGMLLLSNRVTAQKKEINGLVINAVSKDTLVAAIVFNLNSVDGTVTDEKGMFSLPVAVNDTLMFDFLGYQTIKIKVTGDLLKVDGLTVELYEKPEELDSVTLKNHGLVGVLEIDIKQVPMDRFNRIHIRGLKQTYEVGQPQPRSYTPLLAAFVNPIDFVYHKFAKRPKLKRKLKKLKQADKNRKMLAKKYNRTLIMEYLGMTADELEDLLERCDFSTYFIKTASDLQVVDAVLSCHEKYKAVKDSDIESNLN